MMTLIKYYIWLLIVEITRDNDDRIVLLPNGKLPVLGLKNEKNKKI